MADIIKLHDLRPTKGANTSKTRVGRGEASKGKTAGRGTKGTHARKQVSAAFEGGQMPIHMRLPKLKGFKNPNKITYQVVNVADLAEAFPQGGDVAVADIVAAGLVRAKQPVKVLGGAEDERHVGLLEEQPHELRFQRLLGRGFVVRAADGRPLDEQRVDGP